MTEGTGAGGGTDRWNSDGRRLLVLWRCDTIVSLREMPTGGGGGCSCGGGGTEIVCERLMRCGGARGPPRTAGVLLNSTGRGAAGGLSRGLFLRVREGEGGLMGLRRLARRPMDAKKPWPEREDPLARGTW